MSLRQRITEKCWKDPPVDTEVDIIQVNLPPGKKVDVLMVNIYIYQYKLILSDIGSSQAKRVLVNIHSLKQT